MRQHLGSWRFRLFAAAAFTFLFAAPRGLAVCNSYSFSGGSGTFNWTDTTQWTPTGFPGSVGCDDATNNVSSTTIVVDSVIPSALGNLLWNCSSCEIDINSGGQLTIGGGGTIAGGATIVVDGGTLIVNAPGPAGLTFQSGARLHLLAGTVGGTGVLKFMNGANLDFDSFSSAVIEGVTIENSGTISLAPITPTDLTLANGAQINNNSTGTLFIGNNLGNIFFGAGTEAIHNGGLVNMSSGNRTTVHVALDNLAGGSGVQIDSGILALAAGGNGDAPFVLNNDSALDFPSGTYTLTPNGIVSGSGTLAVSGGTLSIGGVTAPSNFSMSDGTLTGDGFLTVAHDFTWSRGTIEGTGGTQIEGTGHGFFTGADGPMLLDGRNFDLYGYLEYSATANPLTLKGGTTFAVYGTFDIRDDGSIACDCSNPPRLKVSPNGNITKSDGPGVFVVGVPTENENFISVNKGTLKFSKDGSHTGAFFSSANTLFEFAGGSTVMTGFLSTDGSVAFTAGSADVDGFYEVHEKTTIDGANVSFSDPATTKDFALLGGTITVDDFRMTGAGLWSGGTIQGSSFTVSGSGTLTIDAANGDVFLVNAVLTNDGTVDYAEASSGSAVVGGKRIATLSVDHLELQDGAIVNNGVFDLQDDLPITVGGGIIGAKVQHRVRTDSAPANSFQNNGTLKKSGGTGTTSFEPDLYNAGAIKALAATLDLENTFQQSAGSTTIGPGSIAAGTFDMNGGILDGSGPVNANVQNDGGTVKPGTSTATGTLAISGNYSQDSSATLAIKIDTSSFDLVTVAGSADLDGTFTASLLNSYAPPDGSTFTVLTFPSANGAFATQNLPTYNSGLGTFTSSLNATDFTLTAQLAPTADVSIVKNGPSGVAAGQNVVYSVVVTNNGPASANSVVVADPATANLTFVSNSVGCSNPWPCNLGTLASGQTVTITSTYSTSPSFNGNVTNTATVSAATPDPDNSNNSSTKTTNVGAQADLSILKSGPASVVPGQNITYTVVVSNAGPSAATNVVISDPTPIGIAFQSNSGGCATPYPCNVGTLNAGQSVSITSIYTVPANYGGATVVNVASTSSDVNDPNPGDNSSPATTSIAAQADLAIVKNGPASVAPGQLITYSIDVSNLGPSTATSVVVSDATPPGLVFVSNSGDCTTPFPCNIASLASGASASIDSTFSVPAGYASTTITNTAGVSSAASDPSAGNNSSTVTTPVVAQADVAVTKTGPASFSADANVTYTIVVANNGPLVANNTFVDDPTPAGLTFVSNTGACTGPFPCGLGALAVGQTVTITSTFNVPSSYAGTSIVNTATVSTSTIDVTSSNNSSTATTPRASGGTAELSIVKSGPGVATGGVVQFIVAVTNNGPNTATGVVVSDPTPAGLAFVSSTGACTTFPCVLGTLAPQQTAVMQTKYFVTAAVGTTVTNTASVTSAETDPVPVNNTSAATVAIQSAPTCPAGAPQLIAPINGVSVGSPVAFSWSAVPGATQYVVTINGPTGATTVNVAATNASATLVPGAYTWTVGAANATCPTQTSAPAAFIVCGGSLQPPVPSAVAETTTGQTYTVSWDAIAGASSYDLEESSDEAFTSPQTTPLADLSKSFTKNVNVGTAFFYRVRARSSCGLIGSFSPSIRVAVVPVPEPTATTINLNVPVGSTTQVQWQIFVPGLANGTTTFIATVDKPWLTVSPTSGIVPPAGILLTIAADPAGLPNGTWTGTVLVAYGSVSVARAVETNGSTPPPFVVPVSVSLVTPVTPSAATGPSQSALIVPAVGHLAGLDSTWRSDIRLANTAALLQKYKVTFNSGSGNTSELLKTTTVSVDAGATTALDDVVRKWFGTGSLGESSNGSLIIEPLQADGKVSLVPSTTTTVSSRTYNASLNGTLGQFIPGLPFASFISRTGNAASSLLSLQQLSQSSAYRTNLGVLESSGKPASVLIRVFDDLGLNVLELPLALKGGEQRQLNAFLAEHGLTLPNGRVEVSVTGGDGKVTSYASVVDNSTGDPFLVFGVPIGGNGAQRFVVPGVADLAGESASWRTDVRLFNATAIPQIATLTFFPTGDPAHSTEKTTTLNPGEVKALDSVLQSVFGLTNIGGALHVTTPFDVPLVVTARTYDQRPGGTVGQFVPAVAPGEAASRGGRSLQILQTEESSRFRTNVGIAEITGQPAVVEVEVHLPDSKITPLVRVNLAANEFRQLPLLASLNLGALYNTRITVRVVEGDGRVTAYGSVIDKATGDPTYIPAQQ
jgi:uncharacterized repeat protein (TIGR01451 family)